MTTWRLVWRSLVHHWQINLAVGLGVVAATAVLTGALVVGDSVRASLRRLTLERLGRVDEMVSAGRFFRTELADELAASDPVSDAELDVIPAILLRGTVANPKTKRQASRVNIVGCDQRFWQSGTGGPDAEPESNQVVLNEPLARQLNLAAGDEIVLRLPLPSDIPSDTALGRKDETVRSERLTVSAVIPAEGLGRFDLRPNQALPNNAFVSLDTLAKLADKPGRVNTLFIAGASAEEPLADDVHDALQAALAPELIDYGLRLERVERPTGAYFNLTSESMLVPQSVVEAVEAKFPDAQRALTYLANTIVKSDEQDETKFVPYSTITGIASDTTLGPLLDAEGKPIEIEAGEIVLNDWPTRVGKLDVAPGDLVSVSYFEPESTHGTPQEVTREFTLKAIVPLRAGDAADPAGPLTPAGDRNLTPEMSGVTDQESINDWNPPFPFDQDRVDDRDEEYWDEYRATPKAFINLAESQTLWGNRFGQITSLRIPATDDLATIDDVTKRLALVPARFGFPLEPVKARGLAASAGTTPFSLLFIGFSMFIIAAAVMLVALLFRLGVERRASEIGIELAVGLPQKQVRRQLLIEAAAVAIDSGIAGAAAGVGYAWLMLAGLRTWWVDAVRTPFLQLEIVWVSLLIGFAAGVLTSLLAIWWTLWRMRNLPVRRLLAGQASEATDLATKPPRVAQWVAGVSLVLAVCVAAFGFTQTSMAQAGAFFGSGMLMLTAALALVWIRLKYRAGTKLTWTGPAVLGRLAVRNGARNPSRSTLTIGLVAAAAFLIVGLSAFQIDPSQQSPDRASGNGGYALVAESDQPIFYDVDRKEGRAELGLSRDEELLAQTMIVSARVKPGDDASCLNLYQSRQPRVLGLPDSFLERKSFEWASTLAESDEEKDNPWLLLDKDYGTTDDGNPLVPVVLDMNTAMYSLHLGGSAGSVYEVEDDSGRKTYYKVVGLLMNSLFHGDLLVSERNFLELFPEVNGYQFFLVESNADDSGTHFNQLARLAATALTGDDDDLLAEVGAYDELKQDKWQEAIAGLRDRPGFVETRTAFERALGPLPDFVFNQQAAEAFLGSIRLVDSGRLTSDEIVALINDPVTNQQYALEGALGDYGFSAERSGERLAGFLAVQNTYISTFQSLGGLGLLLGTFGLAVVQLRNVLERRSELAVMRATGFRRARLAWMVMIENVALLLAGLAAGTAAAAVAVLPHLIGGGAVVPFGWLASTLGIILLVGLMAGLAAVRATLKAPLVAALRGD